MRPAVHGQDAVSDWRTDAPAFVVPVGCAVQMLGKGSFGKVFLVRLVPSGEVYAMKVSWETWTARLLSRYDSRFRLVREQRGCQRSGTPPPLLSRPGVSLV